MKEYHIYGGRKLCGETKISGAKNAILPILAATVMNSAVSVIHNCPKLSDTFVAIDILKSIGCDVKMEGSTIIVDSTGVYSTEVPEELVREMRSSIIFLGSILGRFKKVRISYPGGCELGARPIDLHLKGLRRLGAAIEEEHGFLICGADKAGKIKRPRMGQRPKGISIVHSGSDVHGCRRYISAIGSGRHG